MEFKILRNDDGKAMAVTEVAPSGAECDYKPGSPEFEKMLALSGLQFVDVVVPQKPAPAPQSTVEERLIALEAKVFGKG